MATTYSVRGVKSFDGRNGPGFSATLYADGRKVAAVLDEAHGGMFRFDWLAKTDRQATADAKAFLLHLGTLPNWKPSQPLPNEPADGYPMDADTFVAGLVDAAENAARFRSQLRTRVLFQVGGELRTLKGIKPSPAVFAQVLGAFPGSTVLNTLPVADAVAILSQHSQA